MALRPVAVKLDIGTVLKTPLQSQGDWQPNRLLLHDGTVAERLNIVATVVSVAEKDCAIDDGTGIVSLRFLSDIPPVGSVVQLIARVRELNGERYLTSEILRVVDSRWLQVRRKELLPSGEQLPAPPPPEPVDDRPVEAVLKAVRELDAGQGADTDEVIAASKIGNAEAIITSLLKEGEIFELRPGKLKILE
ncbi:MAG: hypothetical protein V1735_05450 [Nanoarchaeota archaeon]